MVRPTSNSQTAQVQIPNRCTFSAKGHTLRQIKVKNAAMAKKVLQRFFAFQTKEMRKKVLETLNQAGKKGTPANFRIF